MRVCAVCGSLVPEPEARFCGVCGAPMPAPSSASPTGTLPPGGILARRPGEGAPVPRPVSRPTDSVATTLQPASVAADPGGMVPVSIRARNTGTVVDELRILVEGPAAPWAEIETPVLRLMPGTDATSTIRFRPPTLPLAPAGPTSFVIRVLSHEHPNEIATESGVLTVGEVRALVASVVPATAKSSGTASYEIRVVNQGNRPADVVLTASDPDEALRLELDTTPATIQPGGTMRSELRATPRVAINLGASERLTFKVDVASEGRPRASAGGTLVQQPKLPGWAPIAATAVAAVAVLAVAGFAFGFLPPRPPASPSPEAVVPSGGVPSDQVTPSDPVPSEEVPSEASAAPPSEEPPSDEPPSDEPPTPTPTPLPPDACVDGFQWRLITADDHVCVTQKTVRQAREDEAEALSRWTDGAFGPQTCIDGFVWRTAFESDLVCVTGDVRTMTALDNERGPFRIHPRTDTCIEEFDWREATPDDHVCVARSVRNQTIDDNVQAPFRWIDGAFGPKTCIDGYVWRTVVESDLVCVLPEVRDQVFVDNAAAHERVATP